jgi:glycosyltransferase involved in cell wall biosynthesis
VHGVAPNELLVVSVSRLSPDLKLDALVRAIDAVNLLAGRFPLKLILVGDGPARKALETRANLVNHRHGRKVISMPGFEYDPRVAYAAADLVVGMGSSALRGLSIGRPVIVQGEQAFSEVFEPATVELFLEQGFYGLADGHQGVARLAAQMERLLSDPMLRVELGRFGRKVVSERFSLARAVGRQLEIYQQVLANPPRRNPVDAARSARLALMVEVANHFPKRKRAHKEREERILAAASSGPWPPPDVGFQFGQ